MSKSESRIPAAVAWKVADRLRERVAPTCTHFEIAGSLRRRLDVVGDVDVVCVPRMEEPPGVLPGLGNAAPVRFEQEVDAIVTGSNGAITYEVNGPAIKRLRILLKDGATIKRDGNDSRQIRQVTITVRKWD